MSSYPNSKKKRLYKSPYRIGRRVKDCFFYRRNQSTSLVRVTTCCYVWFSRFNFPGCFSESTFLLNEKIKPIEENNRLETELHLPNIKTSMTSPLGLHHHHLNLFTLNSPKEAKTPTPRWDLKSNHWTVEGTCLGCYPVSINKIIFIHPPHRVCSTIKSEITLGKQGNEEKKYEED